MTAALARAREGQTFEPCVQRIVSPPTSTHMDKREVTEAKCIGECTNLREGDRLDSCLYMVARRSGLVLDSCSLPCATRAYISQLSLHSHAGALYSHTSDPHMQSASPCIIR